MKTSKNMTCPACKNKPLLKTEHQQHEIDVCRHCSGLWLQNSDLNSVLAAFDNNDDTPDFQASLGKPLGLSERQCPNCNQKLQKYHLLQQYEVEIDVCHPCDSVWIDGNEVDEVHHSPRLQQALGEINKSVSWKSWLFEFFSRMPVEYNVKPLRTPYITWALILLNTIIFCLYAFDASTMEQVFGLFASRPADIVNGYHLWGILTATFLHGNWLHLIGNMYFLWVVGDNLESLLGHRRYLLIYLGLGIAASLASIAAHPNSMIMSVGASGAVAGLFGLYMVWFPYARLSFMIVIWQVKLPAWVYFIGWLGFNILDLNTGSQGVDYWAHIGGFIAGGILALAMKSHIHTNYPWVAMLSGPNARFAKATEAAK